MRVCVTIRSLTDGGAEKQSILLARALQQRHEVDFVATSAHPCREKHLRALRELGLDAGDLAGLAASEAPVGLAHEAVRSRGGLG